MGEDVKIQAKCRRDTSNMYYTHIHTYNRGVKIKMPKREEEIRREKEREKEKM